MLALLVLAGQAYTSDSFGAASRGPLADNPVDDAPTFYTTPVPRGHLPLGWTKWDSQASTDGRSGFWCIPEGAEYLEQAGRSADSALFPDRPLPQGTSDYDVSFRQWRHDNDYIGFVLGAGAPDPSAGREFGYEIQTPGTDTTTNDVFYRGVLGSGTIRGRARHRVWAAHRIEVRGTRVRWLQDGELMAEGDVPGLQPGGYFGIRQRYERGTRYDDVLIAPAGAAPAAPAAPSDPAPGARDRDNANGDGAFNDAVCGATGAELWLVGGVLAVLRARIRYNPPDARPGDGL